MFFKGSRNVLYRPLQPRISYFGYTIIMEGLENKHGFRASIEECPTLGHIFRGTEYMAYEAIIKKLHEHVPHSPSFDRDNKLFSLIRGPLQDTSKTYITIQDARFLLGVTNLEIIQLVFSHQLRVYGEMPNYETVPEVTEPRGEQEITLVGTFPDDAKAISFDTNNAIFTDSSDNRIKSTAPLIYSGYKAVDKIWSISIAKSGTWNKINIPAFIKTSDGENLTNIQIHKLGTTGLIFGIFDDQTFISCPKDEFEKIFSFYKNKIQCDPFADFIRLVSILTLIVTKEPKGHLREIASTENLNTAFKRPTFCLYSFFSRMLVCYEDVQALLSLGSNKPPIKEMIKRSKQYSEFVYTLYPDEAHEKNKLEWDSFPWGLEYNYSSLNAYRKEVKEHESNTRKAFPKNKRQIKKLFNDFGYMKKVNLLWLAQLAIAQDDEEILTCMGALIWFKSQNAAQYAITLKKCETFLPIKEKTKEELKKESEIASLPRKILKSGSDRNTETLISQYKNVILEYARTKELPFPPFLSM